MKRVGLKLMAMALVSTSAFAAFTPEEAKKIQQRVADLPRRNYSGNEISGMAQELIFDVRENAEYTDEELQQVIAWISPVENVLPPDVWSLILKKLRGSDIARFAQVNRKTSTLKDYYYYKSKMPDSLTYDLH